VEYRKVSVNLHFTRLSLSGATLALDKRLFANFAMKFSVYVILLHYYQPQKSSGTGIILNCKETDSADLKVAWTVSIGSFSFGSFRLRNRSTQMTVATPVREPCGTRGCGERRKSADKCISDKTKRKELTTHGAGLHT
jgi:hypothetical protein